jgi:preprotein translocase subunit YajC
MKMNALIAIFSSALLSSQGLYAQGGPPAPNDFWQTLTMIGVALVFFYLILWRPEQKRRKESETMRNELKKGDQVIAMGIVGVVSRVLEDTVILRMIEGAKIEVRKEVINDVVHAKKSEETKSED